MRDELEECLDELRPASEALAQHRVLSCDADWAGVEVAHAHQDAAGHHERRCGEAVLLGPQERGDHDISSGLHLTVDLDDDPIPEPVEHQRLLGLGQAELPGCASMLE